MKTIIAEKPSVHVKSPASWARQKERKDISKEAAMP